MAAVFCLKGDQNEGGLFQSESQDQVFLRWTTGETATMHILVVHAMVILLTMGSPKGNAVHRTVFAVSVATQLTESEFLR